MVKIRDNQTGKIIQVDESQLGNYGFGGSQTQPQVQQASPQPPQQDINSLIGNFINNNLVKPTVDTLSTPLKSILGLTVQAPLTGLYNNAVQTQVNPNVPQPLQQGAKTGADLLNMILKPLSQATGYTPQNQNKTVQQAENQVANLPALLSYGIPFGKAGFAGSRFLAPGALTGAANNLSGQLKGQLNNGQDLNPTQLNLPQLEGAAATGAVTGQVTGSAMDALSSILGKVGSIGQKVEDTGSSVRQGVSKIYLKPNVGGAQKEQAVASTLDELGIKGNAQQKYSQLQPAMQGLEKDITEQVKNSDKSVLIKDIKESFQKNLKPSLLSKDLTNSQVTSEVDGFLKDLNRMSGGTGKFTNVDAPTLLGWKRLINETYQPIANKLETGGALSPREKVINVAWKAIDEAMSKNFPEVSDLLTQQSNLYKAAPSLSASRKTVPTFRMFGTTIPTEVQQRIQDVGGQALQGAGSKMQSVQGAGNALSGISPILAKMLSLGVSVSGGNNANNTQNTDNNANNNGSQNNTPGDLNHILNSTTSGQQYQTGSSEITPAQVKAAQLYLPKPLADRIESAYKSQFGQATGQQVGLVRSGLKNVTDVEQMLKEDPSLLAKQLLPGKIASRKFDSALYDMSDALLRLRTGAQANPSEIKAYSQSIAPTLGDSPEVVQYKLDKLRTDLKSYLGQ